MNKTKLVIDLISMTMGIAGVILAIGNQITAFNGLPGWLTNAWPVVFFFAMLIDRVGNMILNYIKTNTPPNQ